jgi:hypothetical protein
MITEIKTFKIDHLGIPTPQELVEASHISKNFLCTVKLEYVLKKGDVPSFIEISKSTDIDKIIKSFEDLRVIEENIIIV